MTGINPAVVEVSGGNLVLVMVVTLIALGALGLAFVFRNEVLAAGEGTDNMKRIAQAVQEGANAYLTRQFRTLGIFAVLAFFLLLTLPADDTTVRIFRSVFFLVGAAFSGTVGGQGQQQEERHHGEDPERAELPGQVGVGAFLDRLGDALHVVGAFTGGQHLVAEQEGQPQRAERDEGDDHDQNEVAPGDFHDSGVDPGHVSPLSVMRVTGAAESTHGDTRSGTRV